MVARSLDGGPTLADGPEGGGPPVRRTSGLAIASLILGIAGIVLCVIGFLPGIAAIVLGIVALARISADKAGLAGSGMAIAGIVMGGVSFLLVPFISIVAAIAIPALLQSRVAAGESSAVAYLRTYMNAQYIYHKTDHDGDGVREYAHPYVRLSTDEADGMPIRLIDDAFANASRDNPPGGLTVPKAGYVFVDIVADSSESYDDGEGNFVIKHGLCAVPAEYRTTGRYTFIVGVEGTVYRKDTGGKPVTEYPPPDEEGWLPF